MTRGRTIGTGVILVLSAVAASRAEDAFEHAPIRYSESTPENCISRLQSRLNSGSLKLSWDERFGYLPSVLKELNVPRESQTLVFSKTSLQRHRIAPRTPRALYFSEDVYIGYCQKGDVLEVSAVDPQLGTVFYTMDQEEAETPRFVRQTDHCLICHAGSQTNQHPGHLVRSVYVDDTGNPLLASGSVRVDQTTPFERRWGGWYVTGRHGAQEHLGNLVVHGRQLPEEIDNRRGQNVVRLDDRFETDEYLTPHSDIVALLVMEHHTMAHNLMTQLNFATRHALHYEETLNRELKQAEGTRWDSARTRIRSAAQALVKCLLFSGEAPLKAEIQGTSGFREKYLAGGVKDARQRSLREFDLQKRLFRYPCSDLVRSEQFQKLPAEAREAVWLQFREVLHAAERPREFAHLSDEDCRAIREILLATVPGVPPEIVEPPPVEEPAQKR